MLTIIKRFTFEASHYLPGYPGACANHHGHSYKLLVGVSCNDNNLNDMGMVGDFGNLKKLVKTEVIDLLDHRHLNNIQMDELPKFPKDMPTAENMILWIKDRLANKVWNLNPLTELTYLQLWETEGSSVEWRLK